MQPLERFVLILRPVSKLMRYMVLIMRRMQPKKLHFFFNHMKFINIEVLQMNDKVNLLDYNSTGMCDFFKSIQEKPFRAQQVMQWIHRDGVCDFALMTNLPKSLREHLSTLAEIRMPEVITQQNSLDGTCKWLIQLTCGNRIETVFITENNRGTLCISSQVGCS